MAFHEHVAICNHSQISSDNVLKHRTLSARLRSYDGNLGQVYGVLDLAGASVYVYGMAYRCLDSNKQNKQKIATYSDSCEDVLELVHEGNQPRVVHVDPVSMLALGAPRGCPRYVPTHSDLSPWPATGKMVLYRRLWKAR